MNYAKYQQMLKQDLYGHNDPFVSFVSTVTERFQKKHDDEEWDEAYQERSAIMEYDGGLPRVEAETQARVICLAEFRLQRQRH